MAGFFEPETLGEQAQYSKYVLSRNPFPQKSSVFELMPDAESQNLPPAELYQRMVSLKEISYLAQKAISFSGGDEEKAGRFMVISNLDDPSYLNLFIVAGFLRKLAVNKETWRQLGVFLPFPFISLEPLKGIPKMMIERFQEEDFLFCLHSFLYQAIKEKAASGTAELEGIDLKELLTAMEKTKGAAIDGLFFPTEEELTEAANAQETSEGSQAKAAEDKEETAHPSKELNPEEIAAKEKRAAQRQALADLMEESLPEAGFGEYVEEAIFLAMELGSEQAIRDLKAFLRKNYDALGLIKFMREFYARVIVVIDQFDGWGYLSFREQEQFFDGLEEVCRRFGRDLIIMLITPSELVEKTDRYFQPDVTVTLALEAARLTEASYQEAEPVQSILTAFLSRDWFREQQKKAFEEKKLAEIYPFEADAIAELIARFKGETIKIIEAAHGLIEAGSKSGYPRISKDFVQQTLGKKNLSEQLSVSREQLSVSREQ